MSTELAVTELVVGIGSRESPDTMILPKSENQPTSNGIDFYLKDWIAHQPS